jgi:hypothetical protein
LEVGHPRGLGDTFFQGGLGSVWPDEFVKNMAKNVAQYIFAKINS